MSAAASRHLFPVAPVLSSVGPVQVAGASGDSLLDACRSAQHYLDLAELAFCINRRGVAHVFLGRALSALDAAEGSLGGVA